MNDAPLEVFHYTKTNIAIEKILYDKKLMFNQAGKTNDPRETKERLLHAWHDHDPQIPNGQRQHIYRRMDKRLSIELNRIRDQE